MFKTIFSVIVLTFFVSSISYAGQKTFDNRAAKEQQRIDQGVKSGKLTPAEAAKLEKGQNAVQNLEEKATADGKVTKKEKQAIIRAQNKQSRKIEDLKHNRNKK
jgi:hypothetical protein